MRSPLLPPQVTKALAVAAAVAAIAILAFTAFADYYAPHRTEAAPTVAPSSPQPEPEPTMPGSVEEPGTEPTKPPVSAARARRWLKALAGKWAQSPDADYFLFHADGSGEWYAFGQRLWTGKATPRTATTFDLSDPSGQGSQYWQVRLTGSGRRLFFAGTGHTYRKA
jgi:hypothetical protein